MTIKDPWHNLRQFTDARIGLGPPKWRDAYFIHQGRAEILRFDLRYALVGSKILFVDKDATVDGVLYLGVGMSFNIGG